MKKYWRSLEERKKGIDCSTEKKATQKGNLEMALDIFEEKTVNTKSNRRDFLKLCGYSLALGTVVASCESKVQKAIPYLIKPEEIIPGKANYYASSYMNGSEYCSILIKTREGRPIKIEGNDLSGITNGGTSARVQASVLGLYDTSRYQHPVKNGKKIDWTTLDHEVIQRLNACDSEDGRIVLLTHSIYSPSTQKAIEVFLKRYPSAEWISYDSISASALLEANQQCFGKAMIPDYRFDEAHLIVSFGADFMGNWLSPIEYIKQYVKNRNLNDGKGTMSKHIQFESNMSLTGSNADYRVPIKPSDEGLILANLYNEIVKGKGEQGSTLPHPTRDVKELAWELLKQKGQSLVVSGSNDPNIQILVNTINQELENYGKTIRFEHDLKLKQARGKDMQRLVEDMNRGQVKAVLCYGVNPAYDYPESTKFIQGIKNTPFTLSFASAPDETSQLVEFVAPDHHFLESWNDAEPKTGIYSLVQPGIAPLFKTRQAQSSLLNWTGEKRDYLQFIRNYWKENLFKLQDHHTDFDSFWDNTLQQGVFEPQTDLQAVYKFDSTVVAKAMDALRETHDGEGLELFFYESIAMGNGKMANNPWLQELPDPLSKICWDNYVAISPQQAREMQLETGSMLKLEGTYHLPVFVQPGQAYNTIAIALGYGRKVCGKVGKEVGTNVYSLMPMVKGYQQFFRRNVYVEKMEEEYPLAITQTHHSMENRPIVREATLTEYKRNPAAGNEHHHKGMEPASIYEKPKFPNHRWGMVVDLNSCIGCGACSTACQVENNVPVVGKNEVIRAHEMHWIRIDRYFSGDEMNPDVSFQPVMCQHCDNAPCENVCPVAATNHSSEGLNQMMYNRCIGTRYCGNNCPYKVRRFNWYDYTMADSIPENTMDVAEMTLDLKRMVLNPDVTVRAKGVIEKCSMCLQRIQEGKMNAKLEGREVRDGEIKTACQQACPAKAITFGDLNDRESRLSQLARGKRNYHLLEEIHTLPSVSYLTQIRNKKEKQI
ncbi:MAG: Fe-S-cluster-containing hydrogenase [Marinifilaceae bacterium]